MKFEDLLSLYELSINFVKRNRVAENKMHSDKYLNGYKEGAFHIFQHMKHYIEDSNDIFKLREATTEEIEKYDKHDIYNPLDGMFDYRGISVPVYFDDYGQQLYCEYNGKTISGGCYNSEPYIDFSYELDELLDKDI